MSNKRLAEVHLQLPPEIVKFAETAVRSSTAAFEKHRIADAEEIVVDITWADTPYYEDPRQSRDGLLPTAR